MKWFYIALGSLAILTICVVIVRHNLRGREFREEGDLWE